jgi:hypothetical protein
MTQVEDKLSRRALLRRSLVIAGVVGAPALVSGYAPSAPASPPVSPQPQFAQAPAKQTKAEARYQDQPNGAQRCGECAHFRPPSDCEVIQGPVAANGWCRNFRARA